MKVESFAAIIVLSTDCTNMARQPDSWKKRWREDEEVKEEEWKARKRRRKSMER